MRLEEQTHNDNDNDGDDDDDKVVWTAVRA